jgi:hypothetical protein
MAEDARPDHRHRHAGGGEADDEEKAEPVGAQPADEPAHRRAEMDRLLRRGGDVGHRSAALDLAGGSGQPFGDRPARLAFLGHAASTARCESTISA